MGLISKGWFAAIGILGGLSFTPPLHAQMSMSGQGRSLGGYGAATISSYYGGGGSGYIPYNGGGGYVPFRGGTGGGMGVQPVTRRLPESPIGGMMMPDTPIGGASLSRVPVGTSRAGAMGSMSATRSFIPFGYEGGIGMGGGMASGRNSSLARGSRVLKGPGLSNPFRMPPSFPGSSSMAMP